MASGGLVSADVVDPERETGPPGGHGYTVLAYDAQNGIVTIRNPWGRTDDQAGQYDNVFQLSLRDFARMYDGAAYEQRP